jgi:hypothetical protein
MQAWKLATIVAGLAGTIVIAPRVVHRVVAWRTCSPSASDSEPFDATVWARCTGPHRIGMARAIVEHHQLVGRSLTVATTMLGPTEIERDGDIGWHLGEPGEPSSLFPNEVFLAIIVDGSDHVVEAGLVDEFEGPPLRQRSR